MSSLAASRADGYYYPPEYDGEKHGSLNQFRGQHPLRDRARKLDKGILVIRFEMPFNVWCGGCNHLIGKGVRFNADKEQIGMYHSTRIWRFSMRCPSCAHKILLETDPKNTEYVVASGARRKVETWTAENAETIELPDKGEEHMMAALDAPIQKLEQGDRDRRKGQTLSARVGELYYDSNMKFKDDYTANKRLRLANRQQRGEEKGLDCQRKKYGLSEDVKLLPEAEEDKSVSMSMECRGRNGFAKNLVAKRQAIKAESIFSNKASSSRPDSLAKPALQAGAIRKNKLRTF